MSDKQNKDQELLSFVNEARRFLGAIDSPEWVGSAELTDAEHIEEMSSILRLSRASHDLPERTVMHSVRSFKTGLIMAATGHTPRAADRARFLTGLLTALPRLLEGIETSLAENREQRQTIRQLQAQVDHLLSTIPSPVEAS
jgi:hypothetical protein